MSAQESRNAVSTRQYFSGKGAVPVFGSIRVATGATLIIAPTLVARSLGVKEHDAKRIAWLYRAQGVRDVLLGAGTLRAWMFNEHIDGWVGALSASKAADALAFLAAGLRQDMARSRSLALATIAALGSAAEAYVAITADHEDELEEDWHDLTHLDTLTEWAEAVPFETG